MALEVNIKPHPTNSHELEGILIPGNSAFHWLQQMEFLHLNPENASAFVIPGNRPNSIWGCMLLPNNFDSKKSIGPNYRCQKVHTLLYIPEYSTLYPKITAAEIEKLLSNKAHVFHPEFGLAALGDPVPWSDLIQLPDVKTDVVKRPEASVFIPQELRSAQIQPTAPETVIQSFVSDVVSEKKQFNDEPLSLLEQIKLQFYRQSIPSSYKGNSTSDASKINPTPGQSTPSWFEKLVNSIFGKNNNLLRNMAMDQDVLEERNKKNIEKLMDLLKNNPDEALKYAIPLDEKGTSRGGDNGLFQMQKRWFDFDLFKSRPHSPSGGGGVNIGADYSLQLMQQYQQIAQDLKEKKEYAKAAFVYLKLLGNKNLAALMLELGAMYEQAAAIYLQDNQKEKAADCYEKGRMWKEAIEIHKELGNNEKVGDLYMGLNQKQNAHIYYHKVSSAYQASGQYLKASFILHNKIGDFHACQEILMRGWKEQKDAFNCLNNYLNNLRDAHLVLDELQRIYKEGCDGQEGVLLLVIKTEFEKSNDTQSQLRELAYTLISEKLATTPLIASQLLSFNPDDKIMVKDTLRFKQNAFPPDWDFRTA